MKKILSRRTRSAQDKQQLSCCSTSEIGSRGKLQHSQHAALRSQWNSWTTLSPKRSKKLGTLRPWNRIAANSLDSVYLGRGLRVFLVLVLHSHGHCLPPSLGLSAFTGFSYIYKHRNLTKKYDFDMKIWDNEWGPKGKRLHDRWWGVGMKFGGSTMTR